VDDAKFQQTVTRVESLGVTTIAGCHTPTIEHTHVAQAFDQMRTFTSMTVPPEPDQSVLDEIQRALTTIAA
jgi:hypothetical protein